jgi:hypothetical protein
MDFALKRCLYGSSTGLLYGPSTKLLHGACSCPWYVVYRSVYTNKFIDSAVEDGSIYPCGNFSGTFIPLLVVIIIVIILLYYYYIIISVVTFLALFLPVPGFCMVEESIVQDDERS